MYTVFHILVLQTTFWLFCGKKIHQDKEVNIIKWVAR